MIACFVSSFVVFVFHFCFVLLRLPELFLSCFLSSSVLSAFLLTLAVVVIAEEMDSVGIDSSLSCRLLLIYGWFVLSLLVFAAVAPAFKYLHFLGVKPLQSLLWRTQPMSLMVIPIAVFECSRHSVEERRSWMTGIALKHSFAKVDCLLFQAVFSTPR